jgi:hypothetical protein
MAQNDNLENFDLGAGHSALDYWVFYLPVIWYNDILWKSNET